MSAAVKPYFLPLILTIATARKTITSHYKSDNKFPLKPHSQLAFNSIYTHSYTAPSSLCRESLMQRSKTTGKLRRTRLWSSLGVCFAKIMSSTPYSFAHRKKAAIKVVAKHRTTPLLPYLTMCLFFYVRLFFFKTSFFGACVEISSVKMKTVFNLNLKIVNNKRC